MDKIIDSNSKATGKKNELVAELQRVSQENQKLISMIKLVSSDYHSLQMQFMKHQEEYLRSSPRSMGKTLKLGLDVAEDINGTESFRQQVNMDYNVISSSSEETSGSSLQKNCKYTVDDSHLPSKKRKIKYVSEQSDSENWNSCTDEDLPNKEGSGLKTVAVHKKVVTVQTKLETTAVSEGRQWRKYGQKMTLNNPWPRAYYRCAMGPCCPVRKHVQRCAQDPSMVSTTYKGEHNHLMKPVAMAVMNCAATDQPRVGNCNQIPFPASIATISSMGSSPTITLDLTQKPEGFVSQDSCSLKARLA